MIECFLKQKFLLFQTALIIVGTFRPQVNGDIGFLKVRKK